VIGVITGITAQIFGASVYREPKTLIEAANSSLAAVLYMLAGCVV
jgi:hypothetical protein